jgi:ribonuclease-3
LSRSPEGWAEAALGHRFSDPELLIRALTHPSYGPEHYQRLEFLGDRVLGLVMAEWLHTAFPQEPEGTLARRFNALVSGEACAEVARAIGIAGQARLGRQARDDGAAASDHVLGDITESLIGALYLDGGWEAAHRFIHKAWADVLDTRTRAPKHPKSALQEWAAAHDRQPPAYRLIGRSGAHHAPRFEVEVSIAGLDPAIGSGSTKQEAETAAAATLLERMTQ